MLLYWRTADFSCNNSKVVVVVIYICALDYQNSQAITILPHMDIPQQSFRQNFYKLQILSKTLSLEILNHNYEKGVTIKWEGINHNRFIEYLILILLFLADKRGVEGKRLASLRWLGRWLNWIDGDLLFCMCMWGVWEIVNYADIDRGIK